MKTLFITLSNIGDVILTTPVLRLLLEEGHRVSVLVGPKAAALFSQDPAIEQVFVYDKHASLGRKLQLLRMLRRLGFDKVVDLRRTLFPLLLQGPKAIAAMRQEGYGQFHAVYDHARRAFGHLPVLEKLRLRVHVPREAEQSAQRNLATLGEEFIAVLPGAATHRKRWPAKHFAQALRGWQQDRGVESVVILGGPDAATPAAEIAGQLQGSGLRVLDLTQKTCLLETAAVLRRSSHVLSNDSGPMHLAAAMGTPVTALFGPSDPARYGPFGEGHTVLQNREGCAPCAQGNFHDGEHSCLRNLLPSQSRHCEPFAALEGKLREAISHDCNQIASAPAGPRNDESKLSILVVRTDRIGDVLCTTPAVRALRQAYPDAWISMMVAPIAEQAVRLNPDIDEVLVYDKRARWGRILQLLRALRARRFDAAMIGHCTKPVNLLVWLAGIPTRIGFARRWPRLLTHPVPNVKVLGDKHEVDHMLDLAAMLGASTASAGGQQRVGKVIERRPIFHFSPADLQFAKIMLKRFGIKEGRGPIVAIHADSSSPSKRWPAEKFAELAHMLAANPNLQPVMIGGIAGPYSGPYSGDTHRIPNSLESHRAGNRVSGVCPPNRWHVADLRGLLTLRETAALLSRCALLISADSGPVHIAAAVGTQNLTIFGRSRPGLGPRSWGPLGPRDRVLQKDVGCTVCLADACTIQYQCLRELSVAEVFERAIALIQPVLWSTVEPASAGHREARVP